jgi:decaprenyl-phosphate phosphoribosyltransferase
LTVEDTHRAGEPALPAPAATAYLRALRPRQWVKNLLVFAAPIAAGDALHASDLGPACLAFIAFCAGASGTYLLNDARDVEADRRHPTKRYRPIAAGQVPLSAAYAMSAVLLVGSIALAFAVRVDFGITLLGYLVLTTSYSFALKRQPIIDIVAVAGCYVLRAVGGATATGLPISQWFFIVTSFGALMIVVGKRESELRALGPDAAAVRATLGVYTIDFLRYVRAVATGVVLVAYCLWAFDSAAHADSGTIWFQLSIVPFVTAILQYGLIIERGGGEHPETVLTSDRGILLSGAAWAVVYAYAVYRA